MMCRNVVFNELMPGHTYTMIVMTNSGDRAVRPASLEEPVSPADVQSDDWSVHHLSNAVCVCGQSLRRSPSCGSVIRAAQTLCRCAGTGAAGAVDL